MIIIVYSGTSQGNVAKQLGESEYSYYFVLKEFRPTLEKFGIVVAIGDPGHEPDSIRRSAAAHGQDSIFLSFTPPHQTPLGLSCPTIPVFAWEFDTLPTELWNDDPQNHWPEALARLGRAITHSNYTVERIKAVMGQDFPIVSIPSPVWDRFDPVFRKYPPEPVCPGVELSVVGTVVDSASPGFASDTPQLPEPSGTDAPYPLNLSGVIYCSVFNPQDGRKNWQDMLCAFCFEFRDDPDATLVFKLTHHDRTKAFEHLFGTIYLLLPFKCRVVLIQGYFSDTDYEKLVGATSYALNASAGEGQCLPLMEFMSAGKPAVAPRHTALADYMTDENSFYVDTSLEPSNWPHDPRAAYRVLRHRTDVASLRQAYRDSYEVAKADGARYRRMSAQANRDLQAHCSRAVTERRIAAFLETVGVSP